MKLSFLNLDGSYTRKIALNTIIQIIGKILTTAIAIAMLAYLARYLGVSGYGNYTTVFAFLGFFAILADMGFYNVAIREVAKHPEEAKKIMSNIFSLRILFALFFLFLAPLAGMLIPGYSVIIKLGIWVGTLSSLFTLLNQVFVSIFQERLRMDRLVISDVSARLILFLLVLVFIKLGLGLQYFIFANVIANLFACALSFIMSRRFLVFGFGFNYQYWKYILKESIPLGIVIVLGLIYFKIDTVMLSIIKGSEAVGIYGAPYKILEILITIPSIFMGSVFPLAAKYLKNNDPRFKESFVKSFDFMSLMVLPIVISIFILAKPIVLLILGKEFLASIVPLRYLIFAVLIIFYGTIMGNFVVAANLQKKLVWVYIFSVFFNIGTNLIMIPRYSYVGSSITTIATEFLVCTLAFIIVYKHLKLTPRFAIFLKSLAASAIMGLFLYYFQNADLLLLVVFGITFYLTLLYIFRGINKEMVSKMLK